MRGRHHSSCFLGWQAACYGAVEAVQALIRAGADVGLKDLHNQTAFDLVCQRGNSFHTDAIRQLLRVCECTREQEGGEGGGGEPEGSERRRLVVGATDSISSASQGAAPRSSAPQARAEVSHEGNSLELLWSFHTMTDGCAFAPHGGACVCFLSGCPLSVPFPVRRRRSLALPPHRRRETR